MNRRIRLKQKFIIRKPRKINLIIIVLIFFLVTLFFVLRYINNKISPIILNYAELELRQISSLIINSIICNFSAYLTKYIPN